MRGEISLTRGGNQHTLVKENGTWADHYDPNELIAQFSYGFSKTFAIGDISNRLNLTGEFLVNPKGYEENMLERTPLFLPGGIPVPFDITLREWFLSEYYTPNYYGKYYAALFVSLSHFLDNSDLTFSANGISNLSDGSSVLATNLSYTLTYDTALTFSLTNNLGPEDREFTFTGNRGSLKGSFSMKF